MRQYVDGLRTNTTGSWSIYKWGWQFSGSQALDEAYVPFFGAFGAAWDDAMVARWSANPLGMLWPDVDAAFMSAGGGHHRRKPERERTFPGSYGPRRRTSASTGASCSVT